MCECLKDLAERYSQQFHQNGKDACVRVQIRGEVSILPWVVESRPNHEKTVRRSKHGKSGTVLMRFCPVCGQPNDKMQIARVWPD